jgi:hypothetical protein
MTPAARREFTLQSRIVPGAHVLMQPTAGEAVLLDTASERYFGLDAVGTRVWQLLAGGSALVDVHQALLREFDVAPAQLESDLLSLVDQLADAGLVASA